MVIFVAATVTITINNSLHCNRCHKHKRYHSKNKNYQHNNNNYNCRNNLHRNTTPRRSVPNNQHRKWSQKSKSPAATIPYSPWLGYIYFISKKREEQFRGPKNTHNQTSLLAKLDAIKGHCSMRKGYWNQEHDISLITEKRHARRQNKKLINC
jgi:hypothetical protein